MRSEPMTLPQRISGLCMLGVVLGAFFPWVTIFGVSALGIEGDGLITFVLAAGGAIVLWRFRTLKAEIALLGLAVLVSLVALFDLNDFAAAGLYLTLIAGLGWTLGATWQLVTTVRELRT